MVVRIYCTWVFFTVLTISFVRLAYAHIDLSSDEFKYVAKEDVEKFRLRSKVVDDGYGKKYIWIPGGDDTYHLAILDSDLEEIFENHSNPITLRDVSPTDHVLLVSFTRERPDGVEMEPGNIDSLVFDSSKKTKIVCHGWMADINSSMVKNITSAYLKNQNVNIIGVDWSSLADKLFYPKAVSFTSVVGKYLAHIIDLLVKKRGAEYKDFHLIGHSLGAHVVGFAGKYTKKRLARITGLDPALPGFQYISDEDGRLHLNDAEFVDVIHTCAGILGMSIKVGHADFFPNGGSPYQPGCDSLGFGFTQACSHSKAHELFSESIHNAEFWAIGCRDWDDFTNNTCKNGYVRMGEHVSPKARGVYYLKTSAFKPLSMGMRGIFY